MSLPDLLGLYLIIGLGCAMVVWRRTEGSWQRRALSSAVALPFWPLWAPVALIDDPPPKHEQPGSRGLAIERELQEAVKAAAGTPFEILLPRKAAERIEAEVKSAESRILELNGILAQPGFDAAAARARVTALSQRGSPRALKTAVLHRDNVARIHSLRARQEQSLDELGELVAALRSQLVLARYAGSSPVGVGGIVSELWGRVESLNEVMDATGDPEDTITAEDIVRTDSIGAHGEPEPERSVAGAE